MTTLFDHPVEILTPCFCAGADQAVAEIRAPSIRGELRWWFRALGGSRDLEKNVFGGIAHDKTDHGVASAVVVRVADFVRGPAIDLPSMKINQPLSYLLYFANASGKQGKQQYGPRFSASGMAPPGSTFRLILALRRSLDDTCLSLLQKAILAFTELGALGYRSARACGAISCPSTSASGYDDFRQRVRELGIHCAWIVDDSGKPVRYSGWREAMIDEEKLLRIFRERYPAGKGGDHPSPLGVSNGNRAGKDIDRQKSALRLRPAKIGGALHALAYYCNAGLHPKMGTLDSLICDMDSGRRLADL
jgi:CRISPR type III-B/RAMP module RAMP protein Cmr1